ncbi:MAG: hypothetical protein K1X83_07195 [Oligoflexia bacterium]|nr:hypothetical protein [Oligoflexia bacterium]
MRGSILLVCAPILLVWSVLVLLCWQRSNWVVGGWQSALTQLSANNNAIQSAIENSAALTTVEPCPLTHLSQYALCLYPKSSANLDAPILNQHNLGGAFPAFDLSMPGIFPWICGESTTPTPLLSRSTRQCKFANLTLAGEQIINGNMLAERLTIASPRLLVIGAAAIKSLVVSADTILIADGDIEISELKGTEMPVPRISLISLYGQVRIDTVADSALKVIARRQTALPTQLLTQSSPLLPPLLEREPIFLARASD